MWLDVNVDPILEESIVNWTFVNETQIIAKMEVFVFM